MKVGNRITMLADYDTVFSLASNVEDWGRILPHYRYVRLLKRQGNRRWVVMSAYRDFIPVTWTAIETIEPGTLAAPGRILFKHIRGLVRGMSVEWWFKPDLANGELQVGIDHDLSALPFPTKLLGQRLADLVVGRLFIGNIAGKTLRTIKALAEAESSRLRPAVRRESEAAR